MPLAVTLLVDGSESMHHGLLKQATAAAAAFINAVPADALVEVLSFNEHIDVRYPMGSDHGAAALALAGMSPVGQTALYEAVLIAIRNQQHASRSRSVVRSSRSAFHSWSRNELCGR